MMTLLSKLARSKRAGVVAGVAAAVGWWYMTNSRSRAKRRARRRLAKLAKQQGVTLDANGEVGGHDVGGRKRLRIDEEFKRKMRMLLKIVFPSWTGKEAGILMLHTAFLIARTFVSIYVARLDGALVKATVERDAMGFAFKLAQWLAIALPATFVNSMIRYLENKLALALRTQLVNHVYKKYMANETFYRVSAIDCRLENPDHRLTEDVNQWCKQLAHLYSQVSKPIFDIILMSAQLFMLGREKAGDGMHLHYPWMLGFSVAFLTSRILKFATPPFGELVAEEAKRYGNLRTVHTSVIKNSEQIAFFGGHKIEESRLRVAYQKLVRQMNKIYKQRIWYTVLEQYLMKYTWSAAGLTMIAIPALLRGPEDVSPVTDVPKPTDTGVRIAQASIEEAEESTSDRTQDFVTARALLASAADALERLMSSRKDLLELAGYTGRVTEMIHVFDEVAERRYVVASQPEAREVLNKRGRVVDDCDYIEFKDVPIVTPKGDVLVENLSLRIDQHMHVMLKGPNGCGKSSMFRTIGGLWTCHGGELHKPARASIFYVPQEPYIGAGSLLDQIIYPDTLAEMTAKNTTVEDLEELLRKLELDSLLHDVNKRPRKLTDPCPPLSGGQRQWIGMVRMLYHQPTFAILDECTNAVDKRRERMLYSSAKDLDITLLSVTHGDALREFHTHVLEYRDRQWHLSEIKPLDEEQREEEQRERERAALQEDDEEDAENDFYV
eukprot:TRINITY_DN94398_c0_g1_i1.p1 TRINITY_DN94398_c0_g1~~TRINITY_DN94398_c0_g1_i1.p1  ORF type:complete len:723 (+),score=353.56 TRINITY_DN94398_c0_g1_i1:16-2184(+)